MLLVANHSGQVPIDAAIVGSSLFFDANPPRVVRAMVEKWTATLPFVSAFFNRVGQVVGVPENARRLLEMGEVLLAFPEGIRGVSKPFERRYQLEPFGLGFMRLAIETDTPIVPVAVIGAEEQYVSLGNLKWAARLLDIPVFPLIPQVFVPGAQMPLPTKYRIHFGEPMRFSGRARRRRHRGRREGVARAPDHFGHAPSRARQSTERVSLMSGTAAADDRAVVITGICGRLGRRLTRVLHREAKVIGLDRRAFPDRPSDIEHHEIDIRSKRTKDIFRAGNVRALVHLGVMHNLRDSAEEHHSWNVVAFQHLLEYAERYKVPKVVLLSSANVYGPRPDNPVFLNEDAPLLGAGPFSEIRDLVGLDMGAQSYLWRYPQTEAVILRPSHILGTVHNAPSNYLRLKVVPTLLGFDPMMQVVHQDDVVWALAGCARAGRARDFQHRGPTAGVAVTRAVAARTQRGGRAAQRGTRHRRSAVSLARDFVSRSRARFHSLRVHGRRRAGALGARLSAAPRSARDAARGRRGTLAMTLQRSNPFFNPWLWSLISPLLLAACRSPAPDPAPPPASYELASAPPGARGARAAGTDAAPPLPSEGVLGEPGTATRTKKASRKRMPGPRAMRGSCPTPRVELRCEGRAGIGPDRGGIGRLRGPTAPARDASARVRTTDCQRLGRQKLGTRAVTRPRPRRLTRSTRARLPGAEPALSLDAGAR